MRPNVNGRALAPAEQLKVLTRVWGAQRDGYVFLPWIKGDTTTKEQRRKNYHEGRAYEWPRERAAILTHLQDHVDDDMYFCPNIFNGKRRNEEMADAERTLWADLDAVDPRKLGDLRPTIAWESSPGRYQGVWLLDRMRHGASWPGKENHRLTYAIGADPSGWDATQLLRVPGRPNHKPEYKEDNGGDAVAGRLLWSNGPLYVWEDFDDLPEIGTVDSDELELMDEDFLKGIDRHKVWARVRMRVSPRVRKYMAMRHEHQIDGADRSDVLWDIERELADAGATLAEIVALIRPTVWNKYVGRNDELRRLKTEAAKALTAAHEGNDGGAVEILDAPKPKSLSSISDFYAKTIRRPKWLIRGIWPEGGCGFIAGAPKSYKSWLALDMSIALATGTPFLNDPQFPVMGGPKRVLYLQQEDSESLIRDRFDVVLDGKAPTQHPHGKLDRTTNRGVSWSPPDGTLGDHFFLEVRNGFIASDEAWQSWLDEMIDECKIDMVVIDTLFTSAGNIDTDKGTELMTKMLHPLRELSGKHNCAVVIVHHNKKDSGTGKTGATSNELVSGMSDRAGRDMLGSVALHAWVDTALYVRARVSVDRVAGLSVAVEDQSNVGNGITYVGVPGTELFIERESKSAEEMKLRVGVPRMVRVDDDRVIAAADRWMPQVEMGWHRQEEGEGDDSAMKRTRTREPGERAGVRRAPGRLIVDRLKEMGVNATRGKSTADIADILDVTVRTVQKQLNTAQGHGWVDSKPDGKWYVLDEGKSDG